MIFDNAYWQAELARIASRLRRLEKQEQWTSAADGSLEKSMMLGFYAVRKLMQSFHPPPCLVSPPAMDVTTFPPNGRKASPLVFPEVEEVYDLSKPNCEPLEVKYACNQIIHSHYFATWLGSDQKLRGVFFVSKDFQSDKVLRLDLDRVVSLFETVAGSRHKVASMKHLYPEHNRVVM